MAADFSMFAGDTKILEVLVKTITGEAVDISDVDIRWQLAKNVSARPPLISKSVGSGIIVVDGPAGRFDVQLNPTDTEKLKGPFYYEAEIDDNGIISTVLSGSVQIDPALIDPIPAP